MQKLAQINSEISYVEMTLLNEKIMESRQKFTEEKMKIIKVLL